MAEYDPDVIQLLTEDHREVERMVGQLERTPESSHGERRRLADQVIIDLVRPSVAEEEHLYPAARRYLPDGHQIADRELSEHQQAERTMKALERADAADPQFGRLLGELIRDVREHRGGRGNELFPRLAAHANRSTLTELGYKVATARTAAPTHPHPAAPSGHPGLLKMLAPGTGLVDRPVTPSAAAANDR